MNNYKKRPGPPPGNKNAQKKEGEKFVRVSLTIDQAQREKLEKLGGSKWLRKQIELAIQDRD